MGKPELESPHVAKLKWSLRPEDGLVVAEVQPKTVLPRPSFCRTVGLMRDEILGIRPASPRKLQGSRAFTVTK